MKIALGADHRGFQAKEKVKTFLISLGYEVQDFGTDSPSSCDYPDMAYPACQSVTSGEAESAILLCGTGIGMSISANKVHGIRAALCHDEFSAEMARRHNNANILCLPADLIGEEITRRIVEVWLKGRFEGGRHERRVRKIIDFEDQQARCGDKPGQ
ncbi:MAG TPA: ribose 5-phosphate isomerase B [Phycisphaerae bacterium]|nr:ribose 5-phosphate isomerase B [Phycisphaerae bacterium]